MRRDDGPDRSADLAELHGRSCATHEQLDDGGPVLPILRYGACRHVRTELLSPVVAGVPVRVTPEPPAGGSHSVPI